MPLLVMASPGFSAAAYQTLSEGWQKSEAVIGNDDRK